MNKYIVEFIGTFFLVLTIGFTAVLGRPLGIGGPFAVGGMLMAMVYAGGHISGAHYNPAITLAFILRGKCKREDVGPYLGAQVAGALAAALVILVFKDDSSAPAMEIKSDMIGKALLAEFFFTFALAWVILNVATSKGTEGNSFYGLAIGLMVMSGMFAVGTVSGAAFNPAVALALSVMGGLAWSNIWIYLLACPAGAYLAAMVFLAVSGSDQDVGPE